MGDNRKKIKAIGAEGIQLYDTICVSCQQQCNASSNGQYHCKFCGVMCEECASKHQKLPKKGHWAMKLKPVKQPKPIPTFKSFTRCEVHTSQKIGGYCIDCGELLCKQCLQEGHTACATETIENMSVNVAREKDMREARLELEDIRTRNNKARKGKMEEMKYLNKQADEFMNRVMKVRQNIIAVFDSLLEVIIKDKNAFCSAEAQVIESHVNVCKNINPVFVAARQKLDEAYKTGNSSNFWIARKKLEQIVAYYDRIVAEIEVDKCDVAFEFVPSVSLTGLLREKENIGEMKVFSSRLESRGMKNIPKPVGKKMTLQPKRHTATNSVSTSFKSPRTLIESKIPDLSARSVKHFQENHMSQRNFRPLPAIKITQESENRRLRFRPLSRSSDRSRTMDTIDLRTQKLTSKDRTKTSIYIRPRPLVPRFIVKKPSKLGEFDEEAKGQTGETFGELQDIKLSVIGRKEISIPEEKNDNCITGSTFLRNGRLVLVDYNNKNLKLYTSDFNMISCHFVEERPWDVASVVKSDVAVSFPFVNTVEIFETGTEFKSKGKIMVDRKCHGLAFHRQEKLLYVACGEGDDARLHAYSLDGFVRRVIVPQEGVLYEPCFLTISSNGASVFASDIDNGIIGFDTDSGAVTCQYKDKKVKRYWDLTTDLHGHVFLLTSDPDCLYVLLGEHNGQLLTMFQGENKVCSVCFDPITNSLAISRWQSDELELFRVVYT